MKWKCSLSDEAEMTRERRTWRYPYNIYAQFFKIVHFGNDAFEIAPAGVLGVFEGGRVDLGVMMLQLTLVVSVGLFFQIFT